MEAELLREPWAFPRVPASCVVAPRAAERAAAEEAASADLCTWEENFQDLSGWCMANIPARCDFPVGESAMATKITDTRNEGSDVSTAAEGATRGLMQTIEKKTMMSGGDAIVGARRPEPATGVVLPQLDHAYPLAGHQLQQQQQHQQMYFGNESNISGKSIGPSSLKSSGNVWMGLPRKAKTAAAAAAAATNNTSSSAAAWQTLSELGITPAAAGSSLYQQQSAALELDPKVEQLDQQCDNQDVLQTFESDTINGFDLLSYLWEVDVPSPGDSVSTDSSRVTDTKSLPRAPSNSSAHVVVSPRTYEPISLSKAPDSLAARLQPADSPYSQPDSPKHSPASPASSELASTSRSGGYQLRPSIVKIEKPESPPMERRSSRARRTRLNSNASRASSGRSAAGRGRKREFSDSEEDDDGYRETREKNNEASRKSRMNKKAKEMEMAKRAVELEKDNRILKMKVEELEKLVSSMRNALLRSALKREVKADNMF